MREYEQLSKLGQEEMHRIEGLFADPDGFRRMPANEKTSLMQDYMYLYGKTHPGHTADNDRRMFSEIRSNRGLEGTFGRLIKAMPSGKGVIDELRTDLMVEYAMGRNLLGKKDVADRISKYNSRLDRGERGENEIYAEREVEKEKVRRREEQQRQRNEQAMRMADDKIELINDRLEFEQEKADRIAREKEQREREQAERRERIEREEKERQERLAREAEQKRIREENARENARRVSAANKRIERDEQQRKTLQAQIENTTKATELEMKFNDQESFAKLSRKEKKKLFGDYLRAAGMASPVYKADMEDKLSEAIAFPVFDELLGEMADKVTVGSDCLKELKSEYIRKQAYKDTLIDFDSALTTREQDDKYLAHLDEYRKDTPANETFAMLDTYGHSGRYDLAADMLVDIFSNADITDTKNPKIAAAMQFLDKLFSGMDSIENKKDVLGIIDAAAKKQLDIAVQAGKTTDEIQHSIYLREVPDTELIADDKKLSHMVAHDLTIKQEPIGKKVAGAAALMDMLTAKCDNRTIDGKSAVSVMSDTCKKAVSQAFDEKYSDIDGKKQKQYIKENSKCTTFEDITGFRVRKDKFGEGESRFSKLPEDITRINGKKTLTELDEHERDLTRRLNEENRFKEAVRLSVEKAKLMLKDLEATKKEKENSESYNKLHDALENYTKLGSGFKHKENGVIKYTDKITETTANEALEALTAAADEYDKAHSGITHMFKGLSGTGGDRLKVSRQALELANKSKKEFGLYKHCDTEAVERELGLIKNAKDERGINDNDKKTIESRLTTNLKKALAQLEAAKNGRQGGAEKYESMCENLRDFIDIFEDYSDMPERLTDQSKLDRIKVMQRNCREMEEQFDNYFDRKIGQGKVTKEGKITSKDTISAGRIQGMINAFAAVENVNKYLANYKAIVRSNRSPNAFNLRGDIKSRMFEYENQAKTLEGVDKIAAKNAYDKYYDVAKKYSIVNEIKYDETGLKRSEKEEVIECMASVMVNDYIKTEIGRKMLHDKLPKTENAYDGFVKTIAKSEAFRKNLPGKIDKLAVNEFMKDKQASLKLADKFMHEMAIEKKSKQQEGHRESPAPKAEVKKTL